MKTSLVVGIYGAGVVCGGVVQQLRSKAADLASIGLSFRISTICCRDVSKKRDFELDEGTELTSDPMVIVNNPEINMVVDAMGGLELARTVVTKAIESGKHVVSANKAMLAAELPTLITLLEAHPEVGLGFEAAVGGGIPCIRTFQQALIGDNFLQVAGILNGTTNFMLSAMESRGVSYDSILKEAQDAGFAEADPTADVGGFDARSKIVLLAKLAYGLTVNVEEVPCTGITGITSDDFATAAKLNCTVKLLGFAKPDGDALSVFVSPMMVPLENPVGRVSGATNVVQATTEFLGTSSYVGAGAGRFPTSNSVVADMIQIGLGTAASPAFPRRTSPFTGLATDYSASWCIRVAGPSAAAITAAVDAAASTLTAEVQASDDAGAGAGGSTGATVVLKTPVVRRSAADAFAAAVSAADGVSVPSMMPFFG